MNVAFPCPSCGALIQIQGSLKTRVAEKTSDDLDKKVRQLFTKTQLEHLDVWIHDDQTLAKIVWKGKFKRDLWSKVNGEIRGYGGRFVKSHWLLPLAIFQEASE